VSEKQDFDQQSEGYDDLVERVADLLEELDGNDIWDIARIVTDKVLDRVNNRE
jgi:hypothetical protein